ncbi:MAG: DUF120 domain-containing protein [Nitrososphaerota archaeon]
MNLNKMHLKTLLLLAENEAYVKSVKFTTPTLAQMLGTSQQSASRILIKMENEGLIERRIVGRLSYIKLTEKGINELKNLYIELKSIIERPMEVTLDGRIFTGLGEGAYYLSQDYYRRQIREKFGFDPYPGTLNINLLSKDAIENRELVKRYADVEIEGFRNGVRTYGQVRGILGTFNEKDICAILFIERTHYGENVIEVISPVYLRGKYGLKDGDKVKVTVSLPPAAIRRVDTTIRVGAEK